MSRGTLFRVAALAAATLLVACLLLTRPQIAVDFTAAVTTQRPARIRPDYCETVLPPNIAPPDFLVVEPGTAYAVRIRSLHGEVIDVVSRSHEIIIPPAPWRQLLATNQGNELYFDVRVRGEDGKWLRFEPIVNTIAHAPIDRYLFYRLMRPIYIAGVNLAIHQRDLETYDESTVLSNRSFEGGCINCHSFAPNHPDRMIVQCRPAGHPSHWGGMIVVREGEVIKVDTRALARTPESSRGRIPHAQAAYSMWHPNGQLIAFSANHIRQFFHAVGENRDVFDFESDLAIYEVNSNTVTTTPQISEPDRLETFPAWSPDGRHLYFCSADPLPLERYEEIRYDLMRIAYDPESGQWGDVEPVLLAKDTGLSITEPRVSPDGRWLLFCMSDYSSFPAYRPSSDLYLLDLDTGQHHCLNAANSPLCESWHSWSSNSRWIAFASKRRDGVFARIYFSYVDQSGRAHKPMLLPQKDPTYYDRLIKTYNVPELACTPAPASGHELTRVIRSLDFTGGVKPDDAASMQTMDIP
ncbi:MAG: TolB family protein [Planctomycetota bacterium]